MRVIFAAVKKQQNALVSQVTQQGLEAFLARLVEVTTSLQKLSIPEVKPSKQVMM